MKEVINLGTKCITLVRSNDSCEIDVDEVTKIDYSNLFGEIVTISAILNLVSQWKADAESIYEESKLNRSVKESNLEKRWRQEAISNTSGRFTVVDEDGELAEIKLTDKAIPACLNASKEVVALKRAEIKAKKHLGYIEGLMWSLKDKSNKLNNILPKVTPEEFYNEIIEGVVNTILITKHK